MSSRALLPTVLVWLLGTASLAGRTPLPLIPYPREVASGSGSVVLGHALRLEALHPGGLDQLGTYAGELLQTELG